LQNDAQKMLVLREQFQLKALSDDALKKLLPAYQQAMIRLQEDMKRLLQAMPGADQSLARELWLRTQMSNIYLQLKPVSDLLPPLAREAAQKAFENGMENAKKYLEAGSVKVDPPPTATLTGTTTAGQQISATGNLPGFNIGSQVEKGFLSPSITRQQVAAAISERASGRAFEKIEVNEKAWDLEQLGNNWNKSVTNQVAAKLRAGFLAGQTNEEMARELISVAGDLGGTKRQGWAMAQAIVRTSTAQASQEAHDLFYEANEDLLIPTKSGYRFWWDASNDTRLCPECAPMDGVKYKSRDDVKGWPRHFSCRCKILPITATMELLEEEDGPAKGSFLEATPVLKDSKGRRLPPPAGYTGDNAYRRPMKIDGKMQWVRRRDLGPGQTTAGDMLKNANDHSKQLVLGTKPMRHPITGKEERPVKIWNDLIKQEKYAKDPQSLVRKLLGNPLPPGSTPPRPTRGPKPKPPAPTPPPAPKPKAPALAPKEAPKQPVKPPTKALKQWTSDDGYKHMRAEQLRQAEANGVKLTPFERGQIEQYPTSATQKKNLEALTQYINTAETYKGSVYRGLNMGKEEFDTMLASIQSGAPTNALESWTKNGDLKTFTIGGKNQVIMSVDNKRGVDISSFSEWGDTEQEVLQPNGVRYKVKSVVREEIDAGFSAKGVYRYRVDLEQLDD
jgi:hypothetical protein